MILNAIDSECRLYNENYDNNNNNNNSNNNSNNYNIINDSSNND